jgi:adenylate cyclase
MTNMVADPRRKPDRQRPRDAARPLTVGIRLAVSALVSTAILLTAAVSSLVWWQTAEAIKASAASRTLSRRLASRGQPY